jgi:hypothetical protein
MSKVPPRRDPTRYGHSQRCIRGAGDAVPTEAIEPDSDIEPSSTWAEMIAVGVSRRPSHVRAVTFKRKWPSASQPVLLECDDGKSYVVKSRQAGRMIVNDQVLGDLGYRMGGPVPLPALVDVPAELIAAESEMSHIMPGVAHGSSWIADASDREGMAHQDKGENKQRFAFLAALYGLAHANDVQFIYKNDEPRLVYSVDHGHFFPGGPEWTTASLSTAPTPDLDPSITSGCQFTDSHLQGVRNGLAGVGDQTIADAVARPPDDWNFTADERVAVATYLADRRDVLLTKLDERISNA